MELLSKSVSLASSKALNLKRSTVYRSGTSELQQRPKPRFSVFFLLICSITKSMSNERVQVHRAGTHSRSSGEGKRENAFTNYMKHDVRALIFDAITLEQLSFSIFLRTRSGFFSFYLLRYPLSTVAQPFSSGANTRNHGRNFNYMRFSNTI